MLRKNQKRKRKIVDKEKAEEKKKQEKKLKRELKEDIKEAEATLDVKKVENFVRLLRFSM